MGGGAPIASPAVPIAPERMKSRLETEKRCAMMKKE